jgi:hypothetical protein
LPTSAIDIQDKPPHRPRRTLRSTDRNTTPSTATIATATATPAVPPSPKLTIAQQIRMLEEKMTEEERGTYLDAWDMGQDFCDARY